ncbi:MAG: hypothetical protein WCB90_04110 [Methanosarcina sp.]
MQLLNEIKVDSIATITGVTIDGLSTIANSVIQTILKFQNSGYRKL